MRGPYATGPADPRDVDALLARVTAHAGRLVALTSPLAASEDALAQRVASDLVDLTFELTRAVDHFAAAHPPHETSPRVRFQQHPGPEA